MVRRLQELGRASNGPLNMYFIDLHMAYNSVDRALLWVSLARVGVPPRVITAIRIFHDGMQARVRLDEKQSGRFHVCEELRQGYVSSSLKFNILGAALV
ncbi:unnamed protein product, partial [Sphacelaria rigidula]